MQDEPVQPLIAVGSVGLLQGVDWQVVGFQHRMGVAPGDDEHFGWSEYLLYNKKRGFSFLVDAEDGWSMVKPTTGAPTMAESGARATYLGKVYQQQYAYNAETTYVAGEFYWQVQRGQKTFNRDFANGAALLSMETLGQRADLVVRQQDRQRGGGGGFQARRQEGHVQAQRRAPRERGVEPGLRDHHPDRRDHHHPADHPEHLQQRFGLGRVAQLGRVVWWLFQWRRPQVMFFSGGPHHGH